MSKMFVHYSGTVDAFKAASDLEGKLLSKKYENHIVFIKGGDKGAGAIYTHGKYFADADALKYFSKVSDGVRIAEAAGPNGTLTFTASDPALLAVDASAKGVTISLSDTFVKKVNDTATALGAAADTANSSGSAYARIAQLQADIQSLTGGNGSISEQINNAINALDVDAAAGDYVASISQANGKIVPVMGNFAFDAEGSADAALAEAKTYAEGKASAAQAAAIADAAGKYQVKGDYEEAGAAAAVQGKLDTEVARAKAAEEANAAAIKAEKERMDAFLDDATISEAAVDTLKEIQAYITSDGAAAQEMLAAIEAAQGAADTAQDEVDALEGVVAGVKATAEAAATKAALEAEANRADAAEKANAAAIKAISDDYLKASDKTALEGQISAEATTARAAEKANADAIAAIKADYLKAADKNALQSAIDAKVAQSAYDAKVAELEGFWAWEEL
jgi:hypothetical protein